MHKIKLIPKVKWLRGGGVTPKIQKGDDDLIINHPYSRANNNSKIPGLTEAVEWFPSTKEYPHANKYPGFQDEYGNQIIDTVQIEKGDTLWDIAQAYHISLNTLLDANPHIKNANNVKIGTEIKIPLTRESFSVVSHFGPVQKVEPLSSSLAMTNAYLGSSPLFATEVPKGSVMDVPTTPQVGVYYTSPERKRHRWVRKKEEPKKEKPKKEEPKKEEPKKEEPKKEEGNMALYHANPSSNPGIWQIHEVNPVDYGYHTEKKGGVTYWVHN